MRSWPGIRTGAWVGKAAQRGWSARTARTYSSQVVGRDARGDRTDATALGLWRGLTAEELAMTDLASAPRSRRCGTRCHRRDEHRRRASRADHR